ncbi:hypothetical protein BHU72_12535 [Desulfuribacillus stibiiarsenatis]|uniref:Prepilin-type N-terminal cleavage/methylation domain-containing protein n=1 Tax=Desulfuribacillus stibiiarsenatis TaxID=1390249 RepID=A0A1E5L295_9FIRM|nr:carboxypeptidase regulatory-like domain-containing protein [Desulfuribacillus stibiiarsenatis]OEH84224.1 hypothetical protein BHU72_12535 [Desulfuribacillus stibiiarsenatis]
MDKKGFTLIEILVAIIILSFVASAGYSLINTSHKIVSKHTDLTDMRNDLRIALIQITKDIQEAESVNGPPYVFYQNGGIQISYQYNSSTKKLLRFENAIQQTLIESVESFSITSLIGTEQFQVDVRVNGEDHNLIITRRIKGNLTNFGSIAGVVRNSINNLPIANATIVARAQGSSLEYWALTDANGQYLISVPEEAYDVTASATGYINGTQTVNVGLEENVSNINFNLNPIATAPQILSFIFEKAQNPMTIPASYADSAVIGTIDQVTRTITIQMPAGTNVTSLVPTITVTSGASLSPLSGAVRNFSTPQTYTVTNSAGSVDYVVIVTVASQSYADYLYSENIFVHGTTINFSSGSVKLNTDPNTNGTLVINNQNNSNLVFNQGGTEISLKNIHIDKYGNQVNFTNSTKLGAIGITELINIGGTVILGNGSAEINGKAVYIDGSTTFSNSGKINGDLIFLNGPVSMNNGGAQISGKHVYINGNTTITNGNHLDEIYGSELVYIKGNVSISNAAGNIRGGDIYIDGNVHFSGNGPRITTTNNIYVNGSITFTHSSDLMSAQNIYVTGTVTKVQSGNTSGQLHNVTSISFPAFPVIPPQPTFSMPTLKADSWYSPKGYASTGQLNSNLKIFANSYTSTSWRPDCTNVIIVSKGNITITGLGSSRLTGVFIAPNGRVTFEGGSFEGLVIARDGFFITSGNTPVTFRNISHYINNPDDYPIE